MPLGTILPNYYNRADGNPTYGGTAPPPGAVKFNGVQGSSAGSTVTFFEEESDSPKVECGEQNTIVHTFNCDPYTAMLLQITYGQRGTIIQDNSSPPLTSRVLSSTYQPIQKAGALIYKVSITTEAISLFNNPPDEFQVDTVEINPALEKHPRYNALTYADRDAVNRAQVVDSQDLTQQYLQVLQNIPGSGSASPGNDRTNRWGQAQELLFKKHKGEDTFYFAGYKVQWSQYFYYPQPLNPGGYIEDPVSQGGLPYGFWSTTGLQGGQNILIVDSTTHNQNMFPPVSGQAPNPSFSWLRQADTFQLNRTWFKLTRSWIGAPLGIWDNELYNPSTQPLQTQENGGGIQL